MTQEEGNKLIAEFMGKTLYDDKPIMPTSMQSKGLQYHYSWDWIMPVVEKIGNIHYPAYYGSSGKPDDYHEWDDTAYLRTFGMRDKDGNYLVRFNADQLYSAPTLIQALWEAVTNFIQWYNEQTHLQSPIKG